MSAESAGPCDPQELFTIKETAAIFKVRDRTIWRWINKKVLAKTTIEGVARIRGSEINRLLSK